MVMIIFKKVLLNMLTMIILIANAKKNSYLIILMTKIMLIDGLFYSNSILMYEFIQ